MQYYAVSGHVRRGQYQIHYEFLGSLLLSNDGLF